MKAVAYVIIASLVIAALQYAMIVLLMLGALALLWGAFFRPGETFGLLFLGLLANLLQRMPGVGIPVLILLAVIAIFSQDD